MSAASTTTRSRRKATRSICLFVGGLLASSAAAATEAAAPLPLSASFRYEPDAQRHCPADVVVWVDVALRTYNRDDERWYGRTRDGLYMCRRDADRAGYSAARR
jgi:hypothetical protein